jgi:hypothetical protein
MGLGSGIRKKPIPDPGSRGQKGTGSRIRIRNTGQSDTLNGITDAEGKKAVRLVPVDDWRVEKNKMRALHLP